VSKEIPHAFQPYAPLAFASRNIACGRFDGNSVRAGNAAAVRFFPDRPGGVRIRGASENSPPAGPGLPATSIQYGYISHVRELSDDQIYLAGVPQNEASALLTFYNDSATEKVTSHGSLKIVIREGTTTIYFNPVPSGDLTTPNPDSFRLGTPVNDDQVASSSDFWRQSKSQRDRSATHQSIFRHLVAYDYLVNLIYPWQRDCELGPGEPHFSTKLGRRCRFRRQG